MISKPWYNRIRGLLFSQGISNYEPLHQNRRDQLETLKTGDGYPLSPRLKAELLRELERLEILLRQIAEIEAERDTLTQTKTAPAEASSPSALLVRLRGIGPGFASVLHLEGLFRHFRNRRQVAAYAGLAPTPWKSGRVSHEQGISKAGNPRLRRALIELAWLWLRHQPGSTLSRWFHERVGTERGRVRRVFIVALARRLFIALWRFVTHGELPEGSTLKSA